MSTPPPRSAGPLLPPGTQGIAQALRDSDVLAQLTRRVRESQARRLAIDPLLPLAMRAHVKAGPIDETGWTLLVDSPAVSAKLRQMLPSLQAHLAGQGARDVPLRVKLLRPA